MGHASFSPAVTAGLLDAMTAGLPREAHADAARAVGAVALPVLTTDFLMGLACGVSACGVVAIVVGAVLSYRAGAQGRRQRQALDRGDTSELSARDGAAMGAQPASKASPVVQGRHAAPAGQPPHGFVRRPDEDEEAPAPTVRHDEPTSAAAPAKAQDERARGMKGAEPETASVSADLTTVVDEAAPSAAGDSSPSSGRHLAQDYGDIATNYVSRLSWRDRMSIRARGVRQMLAERMGVDMLEDVPVLYRADGTVGDVGTGWWDAALGDSVRRDFAHIPEIDDIDMTGVRNALVARSAASAQAPAAPAAATLPATVPHPAAATLPAATTPEAPVSRVAHLGLSAADRAVYITHHVPYVDEAAFPERQEYDGTEDLWELAMEAMESRSLDPAALVDMAADEGDGALHAPDTPTQVLPFRPVAGHPEVVDKATYVDYLLRQEFENNSSAAVRRTSRDYLKLIEGGSTSSAPTLFNIRKQRVMRASRPARHMAPASACDDLPLAAEA